MDFIPRVAVLYYLGSYSKRTGIEAELRETKRVMEPERTRYMELEQRSEELAKIRHDFNNQLASVTRLARSGDSASVQELLDALLKDSPGMTISSLKPDWNSSYFCTPSTVRALFLTSFEEQHPALAVFIILS